MSFAQMRRVANNKRSINPGLFRSLGFWWVVLLSLLCSLFLLGIERAVGINWDFHPDSVTYATSSEQAYNSITDNWLGLINNAYYVIAYFLGQSVINITAMNIFLFSITNGLIYKFIKEKSCYQVSYALLLLLLLNPYRVHLSTTLLKDTLIIFFMVLLIGSTLLTRVISFMSIFVLRVASPIYLIMLIPRRYIFYCVLAALALMSVYWDSAIGRILEFNEQEMQLRDFDRIPTFQEFGVLGSVLRGVIWSFLSFSGLFVLLSPAPAFVPVAIGSVMTLIFLKKSTGSYKIPLQLLIATSIFGVMVTGYTAYIRYIYPILVAWPVIAVIRND